ncbi:MAG: BREX system P-loop protein BrxC [Oscillibacter sp.]|nr:BREX system P-loop protein BrxC [Oscillibacter sp.]MEA4994185.1 BREX system P-loop protein BrxC [Oscillibacter sp.]
MKIAEMFIKPIDRDIKGVIKVGQDDGENILQELDEYVVTRELSKHFRDFFSSYKKGITGQTDKMGVWISGFCGSGKYHFLKILSYLLENREVNGKHAIDFFTEGNKIADSMVIGDIRLAGGLSTDVVLFNIDSKSDADVKSNKDAIIDVFMKVFNEMQGFCGALPFLAELERKLSDDGQFDAFKAKFEEINGQSWEDAREDFYFIQDEMIDCLAGLNIMSEDAAKNWCEKAADTYSVSIEKFADLVRKYCEKKGNNHHVVFLVDEIGQYIAGDTRLMLNLQTVTEDLGTACGGKAWIIVTSQQDIDSVVSVKGNDFSKIQGRFDTRLSLSSANVDEVIRKRILAKNQTATDTLTLLYDQKEAVIKNLITFTDDAEKKLYADRGDFAAVYPFIPYQFNLLGQVLTAIRTHGASGKHLAEGERSMIALFKESAESFKDRDYGVLIPFNVFYNALDKFIDHTHRIVITHAAENSKLEPFDVELLKVLFMIKYVKEIKGGVENLTTLMVSSIDEDRIALRKRVEESLARLIRQTLVQKNGDEYLFLTNEEQDINKAIQNETVEMGEIIGEVSAVIFGELIRDPKYRYSARYNFTYNQMVDDRFYKSNQSADIGVRILTPYSDLDGKPETMRMLSMQEDNVLIQLPNDTTFLDEISECLKISKFITKNSSSLAKSFDSIKRAKQDELADKKDRIRIFIEDAIKHAEVYVSGDKANIGAKDPQGKINEAMAKLVATKYSKLIYMETAPTVSDIDAIFRKSNQFSLTGIGESTVNRLALEDMQRAIEMNTARHIKTSLKSLQEKFSAAPYGFVELDVQWLIAMLFKQGKVSFTVNSQNISLVDTAPDDLVRYLTKREYLEKLLIEIREHPSDKQMKSVREVMKDLFALPSVNEEDDALIKSFKTRAKNVLVNIKDLLTEYRVEARFPGKRTLESGQKLLTETVEIAAPMEFFRFVDSHKDDFLDFAEDSAPVFAFFAGEQKTIVSKAWKYVDIFNNSKTYVVDAELIALVEQINAIVSKSAPYSEIHKLPAMLDSYANLHVALIQKEAAPVAADIEADRAQLFTLLKSKDYAAHFEEKFLTGFRELKQKLEHSNEVAAVKNMRYESDALKQRYIAEMETYERQLAQKAQQQAAQAAAQTVTASTAPATPQPASQPIKRTKTVSLRTVTRGKTVRLQSEQDVDELLKRLKEQIMQELADGDINLMM